MLVRLVVSLTLAASIQAQDPADALRQIRRNVFASLSQAHRYLCTETVERSVYRPGKAPFPGNIPCADLIQRRSYSKMVLTSKDRLRLDVAVIDGGETYSWVGESKFSGILLQDLVPNGTISSGEFASWLKAVFVDDNADFTFQRAFDQDGHKILEFKFAVPLARSGYILGNAMYKEIVGYSGTFWVDGQTFNLLRMKVYADDIPAKLRMCQAISEYSYAVTPSNRSALLLPSVVDIELLNDNGDNSHNQTRFSGCHEFTGESKLIFDDSSSASETAAAGNPMRAIPDGLPFTVALSQSIDPETSAAGDPVHGVLTRAIKDRSGAELAPKGSVVTGRLRYLRLTFNESFESFDIGLQWETIAARGTQPILANLVSTQQKLFSANITKSWPRIDQSFSRDRGTAYLQFSPIRRGFTIPAHFESQWVTIQPAAAVE